MEVGQAQWVARCSPPLLSPIHLLTYLTPPPSPPPNNRYEDLCHFLQQVTSLPTVRTIILHARKCHLNGLSPAQNRSVPPLNYPRVHSLVTAFPECTFVVNGGITTLPQAQAHLSVEQSAEAGWGPPVHGVMIGRAAYNHPWMLRQADSLFFGAGRDPGLSRREVVERYLDYAGPIIEQHKVRLCVWGGGGGGGGR